jgi:hypothetical protein
MQGALCKTKRGRTAARPTGARPDLDQPPRPARQASTRGLLAPGAKYHPILRGIKDGDVWGPTDVYGVRLPLPGDSKALVLGQVLQGMKATNAPVAGKPNDPMMPVAWVRTYEGARVFTTTMGAAQDLERERLRRLLVNACYWASGLEIWFDAPGERGPGRRIPAVAVPLRRLRQGQVAGRSGATVKA